MKEYIFFIYWPGLALLWGFISWSAFVQTPQVTRCSIIIWIKLTIAKSEVNNIEKAVNNIRLRIFDRYKMSRKLKYQVSYQLSIVVSYVQLWTDKRKRETIGISKLIKTIGVDKLIIPLWLQIASSLKWF